MLGFEIKIVFEPIVETGKVCSKCEAPAIYQAILQFGTADRLDMKDLKIYLCEKCRLNT